MPIVVIADDLSGAAELAGSAFAYGLSAEVQRQFDPASAADLIAVDTNTRGLAANEAAARVGAVARAVVASQPDWLFKKTDSVLRGHPAAEIAAVLSTAGLSRALFVPANPSRGRTICHGVYFLDGVPLDQTGFALDPEFPRRTAQVATLLGSAPNISVPDVLDSARVHELARSLDATMLPAGAADFFTAVLAARTGGQLATQHAPVELRSPLLLVCGSRASWTQRRAAAIAASIPVVCLDDPPADASPFGRALLLGIGESPPGGATPSQLLSGLTQLAAEYLQRTPCGTLLVEGGATALALAEQMGWTRFRVVATAPAGVGVLLPLPAAATPTLLIKPGSYDWPAEIWQQFLAADG